MRTLSEQDLLVVTSPGKKLRIRADFFLDGERVLEDATAVDPSISWDLDGSLKQVSTFGIVIPSLEGESSAPKDFAARIGPWGTEVMLSLEKTLGENTVTVPVGTLRVKSIPEANEAPGFKVFGRTLTVGTQLQIEAVDPLLNIERRGFAAEKLSPQRTHCWDEIARLTGMKVARNVPDQTVPALEYERSQGNRLVQVQALAEKLGGVIVPDADGILTLVPDEAGVSLGEIAGTPARAPYSVHSEGVYNEVVGNFEADIDGERVPIVVAPARIIEGPLRVDGPYGVYTRYYASELVTTAVAARSALDKILNQVSKPAFERPFSMPIDPRVEIGDTWTVTVSDGEKVTGVVTAVRWSDAGMDVTLRYRESVYA